ncbi:MAG: electron transport complex subunit RnfG [Pseudomonadota bacterium]|jgi:electron transport complex protein RnfG
MNQQSIQYQGGILAVIALLTSAALVIANNLTHDAIEQSRLEDLKTFLVQVVPKDYYDNDLVRDTVSLKLQGETETTIYKGRLQKKVNAVSFEWIAKGGYAGDIKLIIGIDREGKILGVRILAHNETPGLGDKVEAKRSNWVTKFEGLFLGNPPLEKWGVKKDGGVFDQFTGATITPRAVVKGIKEALQAFQQHRTTILEE